MEQFFCIPLRQDVLNFGKNTIVKEGNLRNLLYMRVKGQILVKKTNLQDVWY